MSFIKSLLNHYKEILAMPVRLYRLKRRYTDCIFYPGCVVDSGSSLGRYNQLFQNSVIINSTLGDHTFVQRDSEIVNADIGKFCSIASAVIIGPGMHPLAFVSSHPAFYSASQPLVRTFSDGEYFEPFEGRTAVGNDVWIGRGCVIMQGVTIGTGAVIAAGAVVTRDVPEYAVAAGMPARVIRYRHKKHERKALLESGWWNWSEEFFEKNSCIFRDPRQFMKLIKNKDKT